MAPKTDPAPDTKAKIVAISPIDRSRDQGAAGALSGDDNTRPHAVLWNKAEFIKQLPGGKLPEVSESFDVVVVGGGMSGLIAAYQLKDLKPLVLEQAVRFGGNSKGEAWQGLDYSIGAAYVGDPEAGSPIANFLGEIGILEKMKPWDVEKDPIVVDGKSHLDIWGNGTGPRNKKQFNRLRDYFAEVVQGKNGRALPIIPPTSEKQKALLATLDKVSFKKHLETILREKLQPEVEAVMDEYCRSAFGGRLSEVSAAAGLNFFAGDTGGVRVAPGGNAGIAEHILVKLAEALPSENLRAGSLVFDIGVVKEGAEIAYVNFSGKVVKVAAKRVIFAAPKFVAAKVIEGLETPRTKAIASLKYRPYVVANVLVEGESFLSASNEPKFYDIYFVTTKREKNPPLAEVTDLTFGNFAMPDAARSVLTLYAPIPEGEKRAALMTATHETLKADIEKQLKEKILPVLALEPSKVKEIRITRWGHPLPLAEVGNFSAKGKIELLRAPFRDVVYFTNQDNWTLPGFEGLFDSALATSAEVRSRLK